MTNYLKNVVIAGSRKYYRHSPLFYWYFDSKAKTQDFNASICIGLLSWLKYTLKSI